MTVKNMIEKLQNIYNTYGDCDINIKIDNKSYTDVDFNIVGVSGFTDVNIVCK